MKVILTTLLVFLSSYHLNSKMDLGNLNHNLFLLIIWYLLFVMLYHFKLLSLNSHVKDSIQKNSENLDLRLIKNKTGYIIQNLNKEVLFLIGLVFIGLMGLCFEKYVGQVFFAMDITLETKQIAVRINYLSVYFSFIVTTCFFHYLKFDPQISSINFSKPITQ